MKKLFAALVCITMLVSGAAQAKSTCETVRDENESGKLLYNLNFHELTESKISSLETITKQQIVVGMNALLGTNFRSTWEAVNDKGIQDGFLGVYLLKGKRYVSVGHLPGDNEFSVMFEYGGLSIIGWNNDGSVDCK